MGRRITVNLVAVTTMNPPLPKKSLEELREERRRARWSAFWTPFIALASIVSSVGLLMFFIRACQERLPYPLQPGPQGPLKNQAIAISSVSSSASRIHEIIPPQGKTR
jgi:hypothetical protein